MDYRTPLRRSLDQAAATLSAEIGELSEHKRSAWPRCLARALAEAAATLDMPMGDLVEALKVEHQVQAGAYDEDPLRARGRPRHHAQW